VSDADHPSPLTDFQLEVAAVFFQLPSSRGFLLVGGAALAAQHLTTRPTQDLDFFTSPGQGDVPAARDQFLAAARAREWELQVLRDELTFCRLQITGADELLVDIALDATPGHPPVASIAGPTLDPRELAGRKMIALFDRAAAARGKWGDVGRPSPRSWWTWRRSRLSSPITSVRPCASAMCS